jgi:hypothetical protein
VPDDPGEPDDRLANALAELYGGTPEEFTGRRGELAAAARDAGDRAAARAIGALHRPTRAAWVVNRLARADPDAPPQLAEMAAALRAAQQAGQGRRLRELSAERGALIDGLTARALAAAGVADPPPSLRLEVTQTLTAALADPGVAADFAAGTLTRAVQWSGFGVLPADAGPDPDTDRDTDGDGDAGSAVAGAVAGAGAGTRRTKTAGTTRAQRAGSTRAKPAGTNRAAEAGTAGAKPTPAARGGTAGSARAEAAAAQRQAAEAERQARAAAEREARRQEQQEEAERVLASASAAAAEAVGAEDRLEAEVRDLEERLGQARSELTAARLRARRAEVAERRARQALDRLPDPLRGRSRSVLEGTVQAPA